MAQNYIIHVSKYEIDCLRNKAKPEFLRNHPEWRFMKISDRKIVMECIRYYVKDTPFSMEGE